MTSISRDTLRAAQAARSLRAADVEAAAATKAKWATFISGLEADLDEAVLGIQERARLRTVAAFENPDKVWPGTDDVRSFYIRREDLDYRLVEARAMLAQAEAEALAAEVREAQIRAARLRRRLASYAGSPAWLFGGPNRTSPVIHEAMTFADDNADPMVGGHAKGFWIANGDAWRAFATALLDDADAVLTPPEGDWTAFPPPLDLGANKVVPMTPNAPRMVPGVAILPAGQGAMGVAR